jgi:peptidoglycan/xylan/chitin deacetylase (PgdA/CDA1 family)
MTRWRWPPLLRWSFALHAAIAIAWIALPSRWPTWLLLLVVDHALITAIGLWPRSSALGANVLRLPGSRDEVAITLDDGPDPVVTPAVLALLREAGARATFFCIAERALAHPDLLRDIVHQGHSVQNHSLRHSHRFSLSGPRGFRREIGAAQTVLERLTGTRPTCFRAPAGLRNPFLAPVLHHLGLTLVSWTRRGFDTRERDPTRVLQRLADGLAAGDILLLHDGHAAIGVNGRPVVLDVLPLLLQRIAEAGLRTVTLPDALAPPRAASGPDPLAAR